MTFSEQVRGSKIDLSERFPFAGLVPRDVESNLAWRDEIEKCGWDATERGYILEACARDILFFVDGFLWIKQESPVPDDLPFILWSKQEEYLRLLCETREVVERDKSGSVRGDTLVEKPREVGLSWESLAEGLHVALFTSGATCLCGSRVESDVDKSGSSKTLFWKLDYFIEHFPKWFMPASYWSSQGWPVAARSNRSKLKLRIPGKGTILGSATHENFGRSGRYVWMMLDEFAHTDRGQAGMGDRIWTATTKTCRLRRVVSTPNGRGNKFADLRFSGSLPVFTVRWHDDPAKTVNAYRLEEPMEVGPVSLGAGDWWSPWAEVTRKSDDSDNLFSQEVLLSYEGLGGGFYERLLGKVKYGIRRPIWQGNIKLGISKTAPRAESFVESVNGCLKCWESFKGLEWPVGSYVMGIDVASGSRDLEGRGASNSVVKINRLEGENLVLVAQYKTNGLMPQYFARIVSALGWCFKSSAKIPAYAIWERNGPGEIMGDTLLREFGYPGCCVYWETGQRTVHPGFQMQVSRRGDGQLTGSKVNVFNEHKAWLSAGTYVEFSYDTYQEMEQYLYTEDGGAEHYKVKRSLDPSEGRANHGDTVIATVLAIWAARELRKLQRDYTVENDPPKMSMAWVQKKVKRELLGTWR